MIDSNNVKEVLCERIRNRAYSFDYGENISNTSKLRKIQRHLIDIEARHGCRATPPA